MTTYGLTAEAVATLQQVLDFITEHPERHVQSDWIGAKLIEEFDEVVEPDMPNGCGTYGCVAGWLAMRNFDSIPIEAWNEIRQYDYNTGQYTDKVVGYDFDFELFSVSCVAREALGIDIYSRADDVLGELFDSDRTLPELWFVGQKLTDDRLIVPVSVEPKDPDEGYGCDCCYEYDED